MLGIQPAEMLMCAKAIGIVILLVACIADPWWLRTMTWLQNVRPHFDL